MKPSYLLTNLFSKILTAFSLLFIMQASTVLSDEYSKNTLIIKFKQGTELLREAREFTPKNLTESLEAVSEKMNRNSILNLFMQQCNIRTIKAVKPDADFTPLAGGIERIFIIEINSGLTTIESARKYISSNLQIEYAELDHIGYSAGNFAGYNSTQNTTCLLYTSRCV